MATQLGFCSLHRIAYNRRLDPTCPQCMIAHISGQAQLDYADVPTQQISTVAHPIDPATNKPLDPITLQPVV